MLEHEPVDADGPPPQPRVRPCGPRSSTTCSGHFPLLAVGDTVVLAGDGSLVGLDTATGEQQWRLEGLRGSCPATIVDEWVVAVTEKNGPLAGPDGAPALVAVDPISGDVVDGARYDPGAGEATVANCDALVTVGDTLVLTQGKRLQAFSGSALRPLSSRDLPSGARPTRFQQPTPTGDSGSAITPAGWCRSN